DRRRGRHRLAVDRAGGPARCIRRDRRRSGGRGNGPGDRRDAFPVSRDIQPRQRLSLPRAAFTIARRDFTAILFSRSFIFFLLGPLFPVIIFMLAGGIGQRVVAANEPPSIGIAMTAEDAEAMLEAYQLIEPQLGGSLPRLKLVEALDENAGFDARFLLEQSGANYAAV